jgi:hypothetical protein
MVVFARRDEPEFSGGLIGAQEADFARCVAGDRQNKKSTAARALHFDAETLVGLLVEQRVGFSKSQHMPIKPVGTLRRFVFHSVKKCAVVRSPCNTRDPFEPLRKCGSGAQVFNLQGVLAEARGIDRIGQQMIVFTSLERIQSQKRVAFG